MGLPEYFKHMEEIKANRLYDIDEFRKNNLSSSTSSTVELMRKNYNGEGLTDEEVAELLIVLKFVVDFCKVDPKFSLMKIELNSEIERLENFQTMRKLC